MITLYLHLVIAKTGNRSVLFKTACAFLISALFSIAYDPAVLDARRLFNQGIVYYNDAAYEAAIDKFFESLKVRSRDNRVRYWLGMSFYKAGYITKAINEWENIIKLGGQDSLLVQKINNIYYLRNIPLTHEIPSDYLFYRKIPSSRFTNTAKILYPTQLYADDGGGVLFSDYVSGTIGRIDGNGHLERYIYRSFLPDTLPEAVRGKTISKPYAFLIHENFLYVSDFKNNTVVKLSMNGEYLAEWGSGGYQNTNIFFLGPTGIALSPEKNLYVSDSGNGRIVVFNLDGRFLFTFGQRGSSSGDLMMPAGLLFSKDSGDLFVCDRGNNRINVYNRYGDFLRSFGADFLIKPRNIISAETPRTYFISDSRNIYLCKEDSKQYKSIFYSVSDSESRDMYPLGLARDSSGYIYTGDGISGDIEVYRPVKTAYVNLNVQFEKAYLRSFPDVFITVSVRNKDGKPLTGMKKENFEIFENGVKKDFIINELPGEYRAIRMTLLAEKSSEMLTRKDLFTLVLRELFSTMKPEDAVQIFSFGGGTPADVNTFKEIAEYNNSVLKNTERTVSGVYHADFYIGTLLKKAINLNLRNKYKKGILIITASELQEKHFEPEEFDVLCAYAANNGIPVSILYIGQNASSDFYAETLALKTGGVYLSYSAKETIRMILASFQNHVDGYYQLGYRSFENSLRTGLFRPVEVNASFQGMTGSDRSGGYPIP